MKNLILLLIIFLLGCSTNSNKTVKTKKGTCENLPNINFDITQIKNQILDKNRSDSLWENYWQYEHKAIILKLDSFKRKQTKLFPYLEFDEVIYYEFKNYNHHGNMNPWDLKKRGIKTKTKLCLKKAALILKTVNNPNNFSTGECGTPIPHSKIVFYNKTNEIASLIFSCSFGSISAFPETPFIIGNLTPKANSFLYDSIKPWE